MQTAELADLVAGAFGLQGHSSLDAVVRAFWETTCTKSDFARTLDDVGAELHRRGDVSAWQLCSSLRTALRERVVSGRSLTLHWFVSCVIGATGWTGSPQPERSAASYIEALGLRGAAGRPAPFC